MAGLLTVTYSYGFPIPSTIFTTYLSTPRSHRPARDPEESREPGDVNEGLHLLGQAEKPAEGDRTNDPVHRDPRTLLELLGGAGRVVAELPVRDPVE